MFERFTDRARTAVVLAQEEARSLNHNFCGPEHLLLGLLREPEGVAHVGLYQLGLTLESAREQVEEIVGVGSQAPAGHLPFIPRLKKVLEFSLREALMLGHNYIGTEHLLLGLVREGENVACQVMVRSRLDLDRVRATVIGLVTGYQDRGTQPATPPYAPVARTPRRQVVGPDAAMREVVRLAGTEACELGHGYIGTEHLFLGLLLAEPQAPPRLRDLLDESVTTDAVRVRVVSLVGAGLRSRPELRLTIEAADALDLAHYAALGAGDDEVTPGHLLLALAGAERSVALRLVTDFGLPERAAAWIEEHSGERVAPALSGRAQAVTALARRHLAGSAASAQDR